jgi:ribosomal protein L16 Arg81 hydroxylase
MATEAEFIVDTREQLSPGEFAVHYVGARKPVLIKQALRDCPALSLWNLDYLKDNAGVSTVPIKIFSASGMEVRQKDFKDYVDELAAFERARSREDCSAAAAPAYLHDIPLTSLLPEAQRDLEGFPFRYFPEWYGRAWPKFAQVFLGPKSSLTPLHFDCLLTHNLFFQVKGRKRFTLMPHSAAKYCYRRQWRWFEVDVEKPDYERFPLFRNAKPVEVIVQPGDGLYMPPGTLHHVRSLDCALSFNVDWHTKDSVLRGLLGVVQGMPLKNVYYNVIMAGGIWLSIPRQKIFPFYRSYLNYIS